MPRCGFITKMQPAGKNGFHPIYIHPAAQSDEGRVYTETNLIGICNSRTHLPRLDAFNILGVTYIQEAVPDGIIVMDELGFFESQAEEFTSAVLHALSGDIPVIAAVKSRTDVPFLNAVRAMPRADTFYITPENRDMLFEQLLPRIRNL